MRQISASTRGDQMNADWSWSIHHAATLSVVFHLIREVFQLEDGCVGLQHALTAQWRTWSLAQVRGQMQFNQMGIISLLTTHDDL